MGRIIIYVHDFRTSGVVRDSMKLAEHCAGDHDVTLLAGYGGGFLEAEARTGGYHVHCLLAGGGAGRSRLAPVRPLRAWLRRQGPAALVSMGNLGHATPFLASRGMGGIRRVYRISNEVARGSGVRALWRASWMRLLVRDADALPLVGEKLAANPLFADAVARGKAMAVPSGIDMERARALAAAPSPHPWMLGEKPVVLGIGRLRPQKNFALLIEAMALLDRRRDARLVLLGGGTQDERHRLEMQAQAAGIGEDFLLAGETDNVFAWLARAQVFALPSRWEGSSVALLEAMAVGTPVVASALAGDARQVLDHGRYGLLFDGENAPQLADALERQIAGPPVLPADRAERYGEPWPIYRRIIERQLGGR